MSKQAARASKELKKAQSLKKSAQKVLTRERKKVTKANKVDKALKRKDKRLAKKGSCTDDPRYSTPYKAKHYKKKKFSSRCVYLKARGFCSKAKWMKSRCMKTCFNQ